MCTYDQRRRDEEGGHLNGRGGVGEERSSRKSQGKQRCARQDRKREASLDKEVNQAVL